MSDFEITVTEEANWVHQTMDETVEEYEQKPREVTLQDGEKITIIQQIKTQRVISKIIGSVNEPIKVVSVYWPATEDVKAKRVPYREGDFNALVEAVGEDSANSAAHEAGWV